MMNGDEVIGNFRAVKDYFFVGVNWGVLSLADL